MITWKPDLNVSCEKVSLQWDIFREMFIHFSCLSLHAFWSFACVSVHLAVFQWPIWGFLGCPQFYTWSNGEEIGKTIMHSLMFWRLELWCWGGEEYMLVQRTECRKLYSRSAQILRQWTLMEQDAWEHTHLFSIAVNLPGCILAVLYASPSLAASLAHCCIPTS